MSRKSPRTETPKKVWKRVIKTAICVDMMGTFECTPEEEIATTIRQYSEYIDAELDWYRIHYIDESVIKPRTELILFDFGGMLPGINLMEDNSRRLVRYAQDHTDSLIIVTSAFTYHRSVHCEIQDLGLDSLPNILNADYGFPVIPDWFKNGV